MATLLRSSRLPAMSSLSSRPFSSSALLLKPTPSSSASPSSPDKPRRVLTFSKKSGTSHFKTFLPVTPSLRQLRQPISEHLHKGGPLRALTEAKRSSGGRNCTGRITVRARGGGHKRRIRLVDFKREEGGEHDVERIEYDPGRSAHIALIKSRETGGLSYILAPVGLREGNVVQSFRKGVPATFALASDNQEVTATVDPASPQSVLPPSLPGASLSLEGEAPPTSTTFTTNEGIDLSLLRSIAVQPGNVLPLRLIPVGTLIHAICLSPTGPAILARSAGTSARLISAQSPSGKHAQVRLGSGEVRLVGLECSATVGTVSNPDHQHRNLGKAGRMRWLGFRPQARGVAMNATDHPHGGGRGKSKGNRHPVDVWGNGTKGTRTRAPNSKNGNKMVVKERPRGTEKNQKGR